MALNDRIAKIKPYFVSFNIMASEGAAYLLLNLPQKWTIPEGVQLKENFNCETAFREEGLYFVTEMENGTDKLFDAADYVIDFNRNLEERMSLFNQKVKELKEIFAKESLQKIKTLEFTFKPQKKNEIVGKKSALPKIEKKEKDEIPEEPVKEEPKTEEEGLETSSLFEMAKEITGEE